MTWASRSWIRSLLLGVVASLAAPLGAAEWDWTGAQGTGAWQDAGNWQDSVSHASGVPGAGDVAVLSGGPACSINGVGTITAAVQVEGGTLQVTDPAGTSFTATVTVTSGTCTVSGAATFADLQVASPGTLMASAALTVQAGSIGSGVTVIAPQLVVQGGTLLLGDGGGGATVEAGQCTITGTLLDTVQHTSTLTTTALAVPVGGTLAGCQCTVESGTMFGDGTSGVAQLAGMIGMPGVPTTLALLCTPQTTPSGPGDADYTGVTIDGATFAQIAITGTAHLDLIGGMVFDSNTTLTLTGDCGWGDLAIDPVAPCTIKEQRNGQGCSVAIARLLCGNDLLCEPGFTCSGDLDGSGFTASFENGCQVDGTVSCSITCNGGTSVFLGAVNGVGEQIVIDGGDCTIATSSWQPSEPLVITAGGTVECQQALGTTDLPLLLAVTGGGTFTDEAGCTLGGEIDAGTLVSATGGPPTALSGMQLGWLGGSADPTGSATLQDGTFLITGADGVVGACELTGNLQLESTTLEVASGTIGGPGNPGLQTQGATTISGSGPAVVTVDANAMLLASAPSSGSTAADGPLLVQVPVTNAGEIGCDTTGIVLAAGCSSPGSLVTFENLTATITLLGTTTWQGWSLSTATPLGGPLQIGDGVTPGVLTANAPAIVGSCPTPLPILVSPTGTLTLAMANGGPLGNVTVQSSAGLSGVLDVTATPTTTVLGTLDSAGRVSLEANASLQVTDLLLEAQGTLALTPFGAIQAADAQLGGTLEQDLDPTWNYYPGCPAYVFLQATAPITGTFAAISGTQVLDNGNTVGPVVDPSGLSVALFPYPGPPTVTMTQLTSFLNQPIGSVALVTGTTQFTIDSGVLPAGVSLIPQYAAGNTLYLLTGTPTATGSTILTVTASNPAGSTGPTAVQIDVLGPPVISAPVALTAYEGVAVNAPVTASNFANDFTLTGGPPGLSIDPSLGIISGTVTTTGSWTATVGCDNPAGPASNPLSITVLGPPALTVPDPIDVAVGEPLSLALGVTNLGQVALVSGSLPPGVTLSAAGLLSGTPSTLGSSSASIIATNPAGSSPAQALVIEVLTQPVLPDRWIFGTEGTALQTQLQATPTATAYTLTSGALPLGLSLTSTGAIMGTPSACTLATVGVTPWNQALAGAPATIGFAITTPPSLGTTSSLLGADVVGSTLTCAIGTWPGLEGYTDGTTVSWFQASDGQGMQAVLLGTGTQLPLTRAQAHQFVLAVVVATHGGATAAEAVGWQQVANSPPQVANLSASTAAATAVVVTVQGSDADGDGLTYAIASAPAHGTASLVGDQLTYMPAPGFAGQDTVTYTASDGWSTSSAGTVVITVAAAGTASAGGSGTGTSAPMPASSSSGGCGVGGGLGVIGLGLVLAQRRRRQPPAPGRPAAGR